MIREQKNNILSTGSWVCIEPHAFKLLYLHLCIGLLSRGIICILRRSAPMTQRVPKRGPVVFTSAAAVQES